jgi:hypothetical protein
MLGPYMPFSSIFIYQFPVIHESDEDIKTKVMETAGQIFVAASSL